MRKLKIGTQKYTEVNAMDIKGAGNANHIYDVLREEEPRLLLRIEFQEGPIKENGVNGVMNEDLLVVVVDRLDGFQSGPYKCDENEKAKECIIDALTYLRMRTQKRENRGVEGTSTV